MPTRDELRQLVASAQTGDELAAAVAALDAHDQGLRAQASQDRELDLAGQHVARAMTPVPLFEHHTAATDWMGELDTEPGDFRTAMIAEAATWYAQVPEAVKADAAEFGEQARGRARTLASVHGSKARAAEREFLSYVGYLARTAGSGLPQIDQTIDANNQPAPTPYPTEVFDNFAPEQNNFNGGVEGDNHDSQINSGVNPQYQQLMSQNGGGSGFGSGAELEDHHDTAFNPGLGYAEVPLGTPGQIPTSAPGAAPSAPSTPNPNEGVDDYDEGSGRRQAAYTEPDPHGYRWVTATREIMHPFHQVCGASHWPGERCGGQEHTASLAIGYTGSLDDFRRTAQLEQIGADAGIKAVRAAQGPRALAEHYNQVMAAFDASDPGSDDTAVLHGFMAVVRPVLARQPQGLCKSCGTGDHDCAGGKCTCKTCSSTTASRLDFKEGVFDPDHDGDDDSTPAGDTDHDFFPKESASSLPTQHQIIDPNNAPTPQDDQFATDVMFPIDPAFAEQWETGPGGAQPKGNVQKEAISSESARVFGRMDAMEGKNPRHQDNYAYSKQAHGSYLRAWNELAGTVHGMTGRPAIGKEQYSSMTGRPDLHSHYMGHYAQGWGHANEGEDNPNWEYLPDSARNPKTSSSGVGEHPDTNRCSDCGHLPGCSCPHHCDNDSQEHTGSRHTADTLTQPHQTTDDFASPYNSAETTPQPEVSNTTVDGEAGYKAGVADAQAGERPAFADNSSGVSPYVKRYAEGYASVRMPDPGSQDVPYSLGGDSGQAFNDQEAQREFQVAKASLQAEGRDFSEKQREEAEDKGDALPGGKLPIEDAEDLENAEHLKGKVKGVPKSEVDSYMKRKEHEFGKAALRVSAAFVPDRAVAEDGFRRGYLFARNWQPGASIVAQGSAQFEAGLYAGITDSPGHQGAWVAEHRRLAAKFPALGDRLDAHRAFTAKLAARSDETLTRGLYVQAATTVDLVTDGPGTSPDPMGSTPINGPGTPPPSGGRGDPARPGGPGPYQGAPPLPGGPVVSDDVMGQAQEPEQPNGPLAQGFSGPGKGYGNQQTIPRGDQNLAPEAPNEAAGPGYENSGAYEGDPQRYKAAAFRNTVQANLAKLREGQES